MNKTWGASEVTWLPTKWEVWNSLAKHLFMIGPVNTKYCLKEESGSDRNGEIQLMDHSRIDCLNTGIYPPLTEMHINHHHHHHHHSYSVHSQPLRGKYADPRGRHLGKRMRLAFTPFHNNSQKMVKSF